MAGALNDIFLERQAPSIPTTFLDHGLDLAPLRISPPSSQRRDNSKVYDKRHLRGGITLPGSDDAPLLSAMTSDESHNFMRTGNLPERMRYQREEEMEWDPTPSRTLNIMRPPQAAGPFQVPEPPPVHETAPFWYKVPPAPITPAQRLRNPPNQPRLQPRTQEAKENFFKRMTNGSYGEQLGKSSPETERPRRHEIEFAQQKFFPPNSADTMLSSLSDFMGNIQLKSESDAGGTSETSAVTETITSRKLRHIFTAVFLVSALLAWNYASGHSSNYMINIEMAVMIICGAVALRSITEYTVTDWSRRNSPMVNALGATVSGIEAAAAGYSLLQLITKRGHFNLSHSQGEVLVCVMLVHEVWLAVF
jgi:hypothetical protein